MAGQQWRKDWQLIDHVGLGVRDSARSQAFYKQALGPLAYEVLLERNGSVASA
jgi:hypothetical protein